MAFSTLFQVESAPELVTDSKCEPQTESVARRTCKPQAQSVAKRRSEKKDVIEQRGCEHCPLDKVPGINKILGTITGQKVLVLAQSPGPEENEAKIELIGRSGKFFWGEMAKAGFQRIDVDVQNAVRCFPADQVKGSYNSYLKMRNPSNEEIKCCSLHTDNALAKSKAQHILVLGQVAAKALLKTRSIPQQKIFWSEELQAKVYLIDHPAFFIRGGVTNETDSSKHPKLSTMRQTLALLKSNVDNGSTNSMSDPYTYLKQQDYRLVVNKEEALYAERYLLKYGEANRRIGTDIENYIDEHGNIVVTACGFCPKPGLSFVLMFEHKDLPIEDCKAVQKAAARILKNPNIKKSFQWGCSDRLKLREIGIEVEGYDFDTLYSQYFKNPDAKKYGLEEIAEQDFPEFSGYKTIVYRDILENSIDVPETVLNGNTKVQKAYIKKHKLFDIRKLSLETYRLYNGGDADVTKRIELRNKKSGPAALMQLYVDLGYVLYQMEANGPLFDYEQNDKLGIIYPKREEKLLAELREMIGDETYNPASPQQVAKALYETLGLTYPGEGKPNTRKEILYVLALEHPFPAKQVEVRRTQKAKGTYIAGYRKCADHNNGRMRTKWKSTGTATGRLSSGGDKDDPGCSNLQNIHGDPQMRNMLIADKRWREAYEAMADLYEIRKLLFQITQIEKFTAKLKKLGKYTDEQQKKLIDKASQKLQIKKLKTLATKALEYWLENKMPDLMTFFGLDFGQLEVRVAAQLSGDKNLIHDCLESDIHTRVGCIASGQQVLTNCGLVSIEAVTKDMLVWDGIEFVHHDGVIYQGEQVVISYDGLTGTPDHEVWIECGKRIALGYAQATGSRLAISGNKEAPVRFDGDRVRSDSLDLLSKWSEEIQTCVCLLPCLHRNLRAVCRQYTQKAYSWLSLLQRGNTILRSKIRCIAKKILRNTAKMRESQSQSLEILWRAWYSKLFYPFPICELCSQAPASSNVQRCRNRSDKQRWQLRAWEYTFSNTRREYAESRGEQKAKVYDILNAGPRHRFTVEGHLVSNCIMTGWDPDKIRKDKKTRTLTKNIHFGIIFGQSEDATVAYVRAVTPLEDRDKITEEEIRQGYRNYHKRYPGVRIFIEKQREIAREYGYVETLFGLRRPLVITEAHSKEDEDSNEEYVEAESSGRNSFWGNIAINSRVQGTAHQLMICALVNFWRQPGKYKILGIPTLEVHDFLGFRIRVLDLLEAVKTAKYLLEQESLNTVKQDFPHIDWKVPIVSEAEAGLRFGCQVGLEEGFTIGSFLLDWFLKCRKQEKEIGLELESLATS